MDNINWGEITTAPDFDECFNDKEIEGKIVNVYDGDSVKIIIPFLDYFFRVTCRLAHVDTPEIRAKTIEEKNYAILVRDKLREKILDKVVTIKCGKMDKYGRLLVNIFLYNEEKSINDWLIENKYAYPYEGATKKDWETILKANLKE